MPRIARIAVTPVKAFALAERDALELGAAGPQENRRFMLVDESGTRLSSARTPWPAAVAAEWDAAREQLTVRFPGGTVEGDARANGAELVCDYHGARVEVQVVDGPWNERLSELAGQPIRLVRTARPNSIQEAPLTLCSHASIVELERHAGRRLGARRFRMLFTVDGCSAFEEDGWQGQTFRVGGATISVGGPVERCAVVTRDPATQRRDYDTLRLLQELRGRIHFGVYASVVEAGRVRVRDELLPL